MADDKADSDKTVQLTPGEGAKPKLAPVSPGPKKLKVSVPKAKAVASDDTPPKPQTPAAEVSDLIKKGDVLDRITAQTGVKRADAKSVVEAMLDLLSEDLRGGRDLQLPPLGKIKVVKSKPVGKGATSLTVRIRTPNTE